MCLQKQVYRTMIKEIKDFYIINNYECSNQKCYRYICEALLDKYKYLKQNISDICSIENQNKEENQRCAKPTVCTLNWIGFCT